MTNPSTVSDEAHPGTEDTLKSTRVLYRLLFSAALISIVFALTIELPEKETKWRNVIERLFADRYLGYEIFIADVVERETYDSRSRIENALSALNDRPDHTLIAPVADVLSRPIGIRSIDKSAIDKLKLNDLSIKEDIEIEILEIEVLDSIEEAYYTLSSLSQSIHDRSVITHTQDVRYSNTELDCNDAGMRWYELHLSRSFTLLNGSDSFSIETRFCARSIRRKVKNSSFHDAIEQALEDEFGVDSKELDIILERY